MQIQFKPFILDNYVLKCDPPLGLGLTSRVYKAKNLNTNQYVALKLINKKFDNEYLPRELIKKNYQREVEVLENCNKLNNQNIIRLIKNFENLNHYVLVLELCDQSLKEYLDLCSYIKEEDALDIFIQIYNGISCLQNQKYFHRDIKPQNIMFKDRCIKIIDFGFCKKLNYLEYLQQHTKVGTQGYQAPEVMKGDYDPKKSDIYSLGIVFYEILYGLQKFKDPDEYQYPLDKKVSEMTKSLIKMMLQNNSNDRISWENIGIFLNTIKTNFGSDKVYQIQIDEILEQKFNILQEILQQCQKFRKEINDYSTQALELLLIKKVILEFEKRKLELEEEKKKLENEIQQLEDNFHIHLSQIQMISLKTKLNKLISNLEDQRQRSLNENRFICNQKIIFESKMLNNYFKQDFTHLNEELYNEQSKNFKQNLEKEINHCFSLFSNSECVSNGQLFYIKMLKINILIIVNSEKDFSQIKEELFKNQLIENKELSIIEIKEKIKDENQADKFEKCLLNLYKAKLLCQ